MLGKNSFDETWPKKNYNNNGIKKNKKNHSKKVIMQKNRNKAFKVRTIIIPSKMSKENHRFFIDVKKGKTINKSFECRFDFFCFGGGGRGREALLNEN